MKDWLKSISEELIEDMNNGYKILSSSYDPISYRLTNYIRDISMMYDIRVNNPKYTPETVAFYKNAKDQLDKFYCKIESLKKALSKKYRYAIRTKFEHGAEKEEAKKAYFKVAREYVITYNGIVFALGILEEELDNQLRKSRAQNRW